MEFIQANWLELVVVALFFIGVIVYVAWLFKKNGLKGMAVRLITRAEDLYKKGQNTEKMNFVIDKLISVIPMPFSLFVTRNTVQKLIQKVFDEVKVALDYQKK